MNVKGPRWRRVGYRTEEKVSRQRGWLRRSRRKETRERAAKVSLILISISWCDVYLTTRRRRATRGPSLSISLPLFLSLSLLSISLPFSSSFLELKFLARCFIQRHRRPLPRQKRTAALPRRAFRMRRRSSSRYRNLHTIHTDSAGPLKRDGRQGTHLPLSQCASAPPSPYFRRHGPSRQMDIFEIQYRQFSLSITLSQILNT